MSDTTGPIFTVTVRGDTRQEIEDAAELAALRFFGHLIQIELDRGYQVREVIEVTLDGSTPSGGKYIATVNARRAVAERRKD
jgi:hypothetical protein